MTPGLVALLVAVAVAALVLLGRRLFDGRIRGAGPVSAAAPDPSEHLSAEDLGRPLGERATLVHFSTAFCQPCRAARRVLGDVAAAVPGVEHAEIDAESRLDLVRRFGVLRTPTVLVLDAQGHVVRRASGAPRKEQVLAALGEVVGG
jgi:thiol-disulfide isomerase/thioredoxin